MSSIQNIRQKTNSLFARLQKATAIFALATVFYMSPLFLSVALPSEIAGHFIEVDAVYAGDYDDGNGG